MATIFEQLDAIPGAGVHLEVGVQVKSLGSVGTTIGGLVKHPPSELDGLLGAVRTLALPDVELGGDLSGSLGSLSAIVPTDLSEVTGALGAGIEALSTAINGDFLGSLTAGLGPILELHKLLELDYSCLVENVDGEGDAPASAPAGTSGAPATPPDPAAAPAAAASAATARAAAAIEQVTTALNLLPADLSTAALLQLLADGLSRTRGDLGARRAIPIMDEMRDGLATVLRWNKQPEGEILSSLAATLDELGAFVEASVDIAFGTLAADVAPLTATLAAAPLAAVADDLVVQLEKLRIAKDVVEANAAAAQITTLMGTLTDFTAATLTPRVLDQLEPLGARLDALPRDVDDQVAHVTEILGPVVSLPRTFPGPDPIIPVDAHMIAEIQAFVGPVFAWLQDLARRLDLAAVNGPVMSAANAATAATSALDDIDRSIAAVTSDVQHLFNEVERVLGALDTAAIVAQVKQTLDQFRADTVGRLTPLFTPIRAAIATATGAIDTAVKGFDVAALAATMTAVIGQLEAVLSAEAVVAARKTIEDAVTTVEQAISALSFTPITDGVVGTIEDITSVLQALPLSLLTDSMLATLHSAVDRLPDDLKPMTDKLIKELDGAIKSGPAALVDDLRKPLARLQEAIRQFEPSALIGDALVAPFDEALAQLETFQPSRLLEPVEAELAKVRERLRDGLSPHRLLAPLEAPFGELEAAFEQLDPGTVIGPLDEAIQGVIGDVVDALPVDEMLAAVGAIVGAVQGVIDVGGNAVALIDRVSVLLAQFGDGPARVQEFVDGVVTKVSAVDAAALQPHVAAVVAAVGRTTQPALAKRADDAVGPLLSALRTLDPKTRLAAVAVAHRAVQKANLSLSPEAAAALKLADPLLPALAVPYQALAAFERRATSAADALAAELGTWPARYYGADGTLAAAAQLKVTPGALAAWIQEAVQPQVVAPLRALLAPAGPILAMFKPLTDELTALMTDLTTRLASFGTAAKAAGNLSDKLEQLIERLKGLDFAFVGTSLDALFQQVRDKLAAVAPAALEQALDKALDDVLDTLDVDQLLPIQELQTLDADVRKIVETLRTVNPSDLLGDLQPIYEQQVLPWIDAFDLGGLLDTVLEMLRGLGGELAGDLDRVNTAYMAMLAAVPDSGSSVHVSVEVGGHA